MRYRILGLTAVLLGLALPPALAGLRGPGKYCGIVFFDRWDACYLYSGVYLMYVSEKVKEGLRPYAGQAVQIDATDVWQPMNPGDGLIRTYTMLGPAPDTDDWLGPLTGLYLHVDMRVLKGKPEFRMKITNDSAKALTIHADHLAPTVLTKSKHHPFLHCSDGLSYALMTRHELGMSPCGWAIEDSRRCDWRITSGPVPPFTPLVPGQEMVVTMLLNLPPGEFQFLFGYGGDMETKCVASNPVSFDVDADRVVHMR